MTIEIFNCYFKKNWLYRHNETGKLGMFATDDELINACLDDDKTAAIQQGKYYLHEDSPMLLNALGKESISRIYTDTNCEILESDSLGNYVQLTEQEQDDFNDFDFPLYDVFIEIESE